MEMKEPPRPPFSITVDLRKEFRENIGVLVQEGEMKEFCKRLRATRYPVATVGDITTLRILQCGITPDLCIVDMSTQRGGLKSDEKENMEKFMAGCKVVHVDNPPGKITTELWNLIEDFYKKFKIRKREHGGTVPLLIHVHGEEDLASLPCIYLSPEGGHVCYGLPEKGLVHIQVDERHILKVRDVLKRMEA